MREEREDTRQMFGSPNGPSPLILPSVPPETKNPASKRLRSREDRIHLTS